MLDELRRKLTDQLNQGINTEPGVVYLMRGIRNILEQTGTKQVYPALLFYCDWVVHSKLSGSAAQDILQKFDAANIHLKAGTKWEDLPRSLRNEIDRISKLRSFEKEFTRFLQDQNLPPIDQNRVDGWIHFVHLYGKVVQDCPLEMSAQKANSTISKVVVQIEMANRPMGDHMLFR